MWPLYKKIAKDDPRDFAEEIVLTKILDNVITHCIEIRDKKNKFITIRK